MTDTLADQYYRQVPVSTPSIRAVMRSAAFVAGVDDVRSGRAPDYDAYCFSQDENEVVARTKINGHWNYERGRQWARLAPPSMPLKIDGALNMKTAAAPGSVNAMRGINFRGRGLSERTILALLDQGIDFPEPLLFTEPSLLKKIPGIGKVGIDEIMRYRERFSR